MYKIFNKDVKILYFIKKTHINIYNRDRNRIGKIWAKCLERLTGKGKKKIQTSKKTGCKSLASKAKG